MEATAQLRHYRGAAQKVRLVADLVRMRPAGKAIATLRTTRKSCSAPLAKLVESAIANAQQNGSGVDADALVIAKITVDEAGRKPLQRNMMIRAISNYKKRFARPRFMSGPQGRMWLIPRPFCHVTVVLSDDPVIRKKAGLKAEMPKAVSRRARTGRIGAAAAAVAAAGARPAKVAKSAEAKGAEAKGLEAKAPSKAKTKKAPTRTPKTDKSGGQPGQSE
jgi:large subunit ribosomal protein L22